MTSSGQLVPYASEARQIVLRHRNTVVVYDEHSKQLTTDRLNSGDLSECPFCHRPFEPVNTSEHGELQDDTAEFISPQYFRRLATSRAPSRPTSEAPSPPWHLVESKKSRTSHGHELDSSSPGVVSEESTRISDSSFSQGYFKTFFVEEKELGRGGKGVVLLVKHVLDGVTLGRFACKRVPVGNDHQWLERVLLEVTLLQNISHENLVSYRHVWLENFQASPFTPRTPHVFILQQFCNAGTLLDYVSLSQPKEKSSHVRSRPSHPSKFNESSDRKAHHAKYLPLDEIFSFFKDITSGLAHLHANGYVHRDLKPQNCLLHRTGTSLKVLVSDFGEMQGASVPRKPDATGYTGTISFAAPEVVRRQEDGILGNFTIKSDVFSLGMIVFFMCFGRLPYVNANLEEDEREDVDGLKDEVLGWQGLRHERKERNDLPEKLYENLQLLLSQDPEQRPTTDEILRRIRTGSSFSEHATSSPVSERFPSPDFGYHRDRSKSPENPNSVHLGQSSTIDRKTSSNPQKASLQRRRQPRLTDASTKPRTNRPLLMAPPHSGYHWRLKTFLGHNVTTAVVRWVLFLLKLWTLSSPCTPQAPRSEVQYPLIALAAVDVAGSGSNVMASVVFATVHVFVILLSTRQGLLCQQ